jgi:hypothetical protein
VYVYGFLSLSLHLLAALALLDALLRIAILQDALLMEVPLIVALPEEFHRSCRITWAQRVIVAPHQRSRVRHFRLIAPLSMVYD